MDGLVISCTNGVVSRPSKENESLMTAVFFTIRQTTDENRIWEVVVAVVVVV